MANLKKEITTSYSAERVGAEDYALQDEIGVCEMVCNAQGKCDYVKSYSEDPDEDCCIYSKDGLPDYKMSQGFCIGRYTHKTTSENSRVENYDGEDCSYTKEFYKDKLVYERAEIDDRAYIHEFDYDDEGKVIWQKIAVDCLDGSTSFAFEEYIYKEGENVPKEIAYICDSPSIGDFLDGNFTKREISREIQYTETVEQNGAERVVVLKSYNLQDGTIRSKTISVYDSSSNDIIRVTKITYDSPTDAFVKEITYEYW